MPLDPIIARGFQNPFSDTADVYNQRVDRNRLMGLEEQEGVQRNQLLEQRNALFQQDLQDRQAATDKDGILHALAKAKWARQSPSPAEALRSDPKAVEVFSSKGIDLSQISDEQAAQMLDQSIADLSSKLGIAPEKAEESGVKIGQYNPGDYTPESWAQFVQSKDPRGLRRQYAPAQPATMIIGGVPSIVDKGSGTARPLSTLPAEVNAAAQLKGAEVGAAQSATANVEQQVKARERQNALQLYEAARDGLISGLGGSKTGPVVGRIPAVTAPQQIAEGSVAAMAPVLKQLFRVAGEGVFTDRDQALLIDMVPKRSDLPEARKAKMANIDAIVKAKLQMAPATGAKRKRYNPVTGLIEEY